MAYTNIDDPSAYFQTALYTGNGSTKSITNDGNSNMQPDWVWVKSRSIAYHHVVFDSSRGVNKRLATNLNIAEDTGDGYGTVSAFNSDGFSVSSGANTNNNNATYVAWQWKANGGTTTSVSASGTGNGCINACTHQANTTAGFSIITYTGRDDQLNNGQESKLTHGLGVAPKVFICKRRDSADDWFYLGGDQASVRQGWYNGFLSLNDADAVNGNHYVSSTQPDSTHIYLGNEKVNIASATYVGYAFAEVQGYSKFGKYGGNGNASGPFVYTGFKPAFLMIKRTDTSANWDMFTAEINAFNVVSNRLRANLSDAEQTGFDRLDFLSNGFKVRNTNTTGNISGGTYVYMAFAENPFITSTGVPTTAQ